MLSEKIFHIPLSIINIGLLYQSYFMRSKNNIRSENYFL